MIPELLTGRRVAVLASTVVLLSMFAAGQESNGKNQPQPYALIFGTVWSPEGQVMAGVPIRIRRADEKKAKWRLVSDRRGEFAQRVPAGKAEYVAWADIKVPKGETPPEVRVQVEQDERVDIGLHLTKVTGRELTN